MICAKINSCAKGRDKNGYPGLLRSFCYLQVYIENKYVAA